MTLWACHPGMRRTPCSLKIAYYWPPGCRISLRGAVRRALFASQDKDNSQQQPNLQRGPEHHRHWRDLASMPPFVFADPPTCIA
ncbi:hypothetical protein Pint_32907 [Pistacia integerrima]|uniref:Uncharacterized protein n=1 Tax=Pistacia integerrima TaxID=434235 RepID=A0ACC0X6R2_9ROSI|nr:hypothetical protein Pint_32907 [Pistacia integerrima]